MSVVHIIDTLTKWAKQNVCKCIKLKMPPPNTDPNDDGYAYEEVTPTAFGMYVPTEEKLPPNVHSQYPSLCVRFMTGENDLSTHSGYIDIQFCFSAWDPGLHGKDIFHPNGDGSFSRQDGDFERNGDGWRDVWNFVDIALRAIESTTQIEGYTIDQNTPVKFGPLTEQEAIADFYPFWYAWLSFRVNYPLMRNNEDDEKYL